ncbi:glycoside hydrolase family protein [Aestuariibaculum lutulentum]|uniref:Asl1-like glycosyl hydrolase catalytic domain-containing protein n=1 Tax=Aestuariibaculum lutulentum TaxID=2920935 RepID=A0ABS9RKE6_9FLAO|nr:hypothetical protein [Aestuariibaculum lutulentum]MCH4553428.1 hypothetical protein [Aestuariibaculum lutulentum]
MKRLYTIILLVFAFNAFSQNQDYEGLWHLKGEGSFAHSKMYLKFKYEGEELVGAFKNDDGDPDLIYKKESTDSTLTVYFTTAGTPANIILTKVEGDEDYMKAKLLGRFNLKAERLAQGSDFDFEIPDPSTGGPPEEIRRNLMAQGASGSGEVATAVATNFVNSTIKVDADKKIGELIRTERYNNLTDHHLFTEQRDADVTFYNEQGLHGKIYKLWIYDADFYNPETKTYDYSKYADYIEDTSKLSDHLMFNMNGRGITGDWGVSVDESKKILVNILTDLKSKYPAFTYIEVLNEPDYEKRLTPTQYYGVYKVFYQAVNEVNKNLNPKYPLQVGGPSTAQFDLNWITTFLEEYSKDSSKDKRLDFISYHGYFTKPGKEYKFYKDNPSLVKDQRSILEKEMTSRGISTEIPTFITEMGVYPGPLFDDYGNMKNDRLRQAAGVMSINYWYLNSKNSYPFNWVLRHQTEGRKDQLVTRDSAGGDMIHTRKFTPYGNSVLMVSKMKKNRLEVSSSSELDEGKGVYSIASSDESGVSIMIWNYQSKNTVGYDLDLLVENLPKSFKKKSVKVKTGLIDAEHSNYQYNLDNCNLSMVETTIKPLKEGVFKTKLSLQPNALYLVVLESE